MSFKVFQRLYYVKAHTDLEGTIRTLISTSGTTADKGRNRGTKACESDSCAGKRQTEEICNQTRSTLAPGPWQHPHRARGSVRLGRAKATVVLKFMEEAAVKHLLDSYPDWQLLANAGGLHLLLRLEHRTVRRILQVVRYKPAAGFQTSVSSGIRTRTRVRCVS